LAISNLKAGVNFLRCDMRILFGLFRSIRDSSDCPKSLDHYNHFIIGKDKPYSFAEHGLI